MFLSRIMQEKRFSGVNCDLDLTADCCSSPPSFQLMDLQLSDSNFRRHILLQYLILFQYLKGQVKFKRFNLSTNVTRR